MKYTFDAKTTIPFLAFRGLRAIAEKNVGEANVLDLSQGEPGYGFSPNVRSRRFFAFLAILDIAFNNHNIDLNKNLFFKRLDSELSEIENIVEKTADENFSSSVAEQLKNDWNEFILELEKVCDAQNLNYDRFTIYYELFKYSNLMGGRYPQPAGHPLLQAVMAEEYSENLGVKVKAHELIGIMGASHGVGATFQGLGEEGIKFLLSGDTVAMTSPVYAPYNAIFVERDIDILSLPVDPETGGVEQADVEKILNQKERIKAFILISPNNPTGFTSNETLLNAIERIAEKHNSIIITDEVYFRFFKGAKSICQYPNAARRLIRIDSLSKIERATGVRAGDIYVSDHANDFISNEILGEFFNPNTTKATDVRNLLFLAKSPGGKNLGLFQHITGIPGPSVGLSLAHVVLGKKERAKYVEMLEKKVDIFYDTLGVKKEGNGYYGMIDLEKLESEDSKQLDIECVLERIAEKGVVLMPANLFFSPADRKAKDRTRMIRVSLPNLSFEGTKRAAEIVLEVVKGK